VPFSDGRYATNELPFPGTNLLSQRDLPMTTTITPSKGAAAHSPATRAPSGVSPQ